MVADRGYLPVIANFAGHLVSFIPTMLRYFLGRKNIKRDEYVKAPIGFDETSTRSICHSGFNSATILGASECVLLTCIFCDFSLSVKNKFSSKPF